MCTLFVYENETLKNWLIVVSWWGCQAAIFDAWCVEAVCLVYAGGVWPGLLGLGWVRELCIRQPVLWNPAPLVKPDVASGELTDVNSNRRGAFALRGGRDDALGPAGWCLSCTHTELTFRLDFTVGVKNGCSWSIHFHIRILLPIFFFKYIHEGGLLWKCAYVVCFFYLGIHTLCWWPFKLLYFRSRGGALVYVL